MSPLVCFGGAVAAGCVGASTFSFGGGVGPFWYGWGGGGYSLVGGGVEYLEGWRLFERTGGSSSQAESKAMAPTRASESESFIELGSTTVYPL